MLYKKVYVEVSARLGISVDEAIRLMMFWRFGLWETAYIVTEDGTNPPHEDVMNAYLFFAVFYPM